MKLLLLFICGAVTFLSDHALADGECAFPPEKWDVECPDGEGEDNCQTKCILEKGGALNEDGTLNTENMCKFISVCKLKSDQTDATDGERGCFEKAAPNVRKDSCDSYKALGDCLPDN